MMTKASIMKEVGNLSHGENQRKKMMTQKPKFKKGDLVRIIDTTHDERIPPSRMGHLIERLKAYQHYKQRQPALTNVWMLYMTNGVVLKFHEMYLEHVE